MANYLFEDLKDWSDVIKQLEMLSKSRKLKDHQNELIRVLHYDDNWRIREAAIQAVASIKEPSPALIAEVVGIMMRQDLYYEVRILAAEALGTILCSRKRGTLSEKALTAMYDVLRNPHPPFFHQAVEDSIRKIMGTIPDPLSIQDSFVPGKEKML